MSDSLTRAQLQLEYAKAMLASFTEDKPSAADVIGPMPALAVVTDGRAWVAVSQCLADALGKSPAELLGLAWRDQVHPDDRGASIKAAEDLLNSPADGPAEGEHTNRYVVAAGTITLRWRWAKAGPTRRWVVAVAEIVERP